MVTVTLTHTQAKWLGRTSTEWEVTDVLRWLTTRLHCTYYRRGIVQHQLLLPTLPPPIYNVYLYLFSLWILSISVATSRSRTRAGQGDPRPGSKTQKLDSHMTCMTELVCRHHDPIGNNAYIIIIIAPASLAINLLGSRGVLGSPHSAMKLIPWSCRSATSLSSHCCVAHNNNFVTFWPLGSL